MFKWIKYKIGISKLETEFVNLTARNMHIEDTNSKLLKKYNEECDKAQQEYCKLQKDISELELAFGKEINKAEQKYRKLQRDISDLENKQKAKQFSLDYPIGKPIVVDFGIYNLQLSNGEKICCFRIPRDLFYCHKYELTQGYCSTWISGNHIFTSDTPLTQKENLVTNVYCIDFQNSVIQYEYSFEKPNPEIEKINKKSKVKLKPKISKIHQPININITNKIKK